MLGVWVVEGGGIEIWGVGEGGGGVGIGVGIGEGMGGLLFFFCFNFLMFFESFFMWCWRLLI